MSVSDGLAGSLVVPPLDLIVERVGALETPGADGGPFLTLTSVVDGSSAGLVRVWTSELLPRIVYTNLSAPAFGLDSHMFYAFAPADSAVPHFTLDAASTRGIHAFHADLMPRAELATHVEYMDAVFGPLDDTQLEVEADEAFLPAVVPSRGRTMMSPWMLANRLAEEDVPRAKAPSDAYLEHWLGLVVDGVAAEVVATLADVDLAARDAVLRQNLFGADVDPSWDMAAKLVGQEPVTALRRAMIGADLD